MQIEPLNKYRDALVAPDKYYQLVLQNGLINIIVSQEMFLYLLGKCSK